MTYLVNGNEYHVSYRELKEAHNQICLLNNADFMEQLPDILHLACMICFFKEMPNNVCLSDEGIIHQLTHLLANVDDSAVNLEGIREDFAKTLILD